MLIRRGSYFWVELRPSAEGGCRPPGHAPLGGHLVLIQDELGAVAIGACWVAASTHGSNPSPVGPALLQGRQLQQVTWACGLRAKPKAKCLWHHKLHCKGAVASEQGLSLRSSGTSPPLAAGSQHTFPQVAIGDSAAPGQHEASELHSYRVFCSAA